jgi:hypothetical protein
MQGSALHTINFLSWGRLLTDKLMLRGFLLSSSLMSAFCKFYGRYIDLIYNYKLSLSHTLSDIFHTNSQTIFGTLTSTADNSAFMIMELGSQWVWPVERGCLLFLGTWSHLRYIRGSVLAHLFLWHVLHTCFSTLITLWYLRHFIWYEISYSVSYCLTTSGNKT